MARIISDADGLGFTAYDAEDNELIFGINPEDQHLYIELWSGKKTPEGLWGDPIYTEVQSSFSGDDAVDVTLAIQAVLDKATPKK